MLCFFFLPEQQNATVTDSIIEENKASQFNSYFDSFSCFFSLVSAIISCRCPRARLLAPAHTRVCHGQCWCEGRRKEFTTTTTLCHGRSPVFVGQRWPRSIEARRGAPPQRCDFYSTQRCDFRSGRLMHAALLQATTVGLPPFSPASLCEDKFFFFLITPLGGPRMLDV